MSPVIISQGNVCSPTRRFRYRRTKNGCKLHQLLLVTSRALESCEQKKERHNEVDVYSVQNAFGKASHLIHNPLPNSPPKGAIKSSICYVLQRFVKANMIQVRFMKFVHLIVPCLGSDNRCSSRREHEIFGLCSQDPSSISPPGTFNARR